MDRKLIERSCGDEIEVELSAAQSRFFRNDHAERGQDRLQFIDRKLAAANLQIELQGAISAFESALDIHLRGASADRGLADAPLTSLQVEIGLVVDDDRLRRGRAGGNQLQLPHLEGSGGAQDAVRGNDATVSVNAAADATVGPHETAGDQIEIAQLQAGVERRSRCIVPVPGAELAFELERTRAVRLCADPEWKALAAAEVTRQQLHGAIAALTDGRSIDNDFAVVDAKAVDANGRVRRCLVAWRGGALADMGQAGEIPASRGILAQGHDRVIEGQRGDMDLAMHEQRPQVHADPDRASTDEGLVAEGRILVDAKVVGLQ